MAPISNSSASSKSPRIIDNFINGSFVKPASGEYMDVHAPATGEVCAKVALSTQSDINNAVDKAKKAYPEWKSLTTKARSLKMFKLHELIDQHADELAELVMTENGKNRGESLASVAKANEAVEWACSMPTVIQGKSLEVSRGVNCRDVREPVGIVGTIAPFNFPIMVPFWTTPAALTSGNVVILKPSEKCPMTMNRVAELMKEAGIPDGVFQIINGAVDAVTGLCDHPAIPVVTFVGSSKVAELVHNRCTTLNKRVLALGGAKNHLVALPDCEIGMTSQDVVGSFSGCAGQRCMAASVLLVVGENEKLIDAIVEKASKLEPGQEAGQIGPIIDKPSQDRILGFINDAENHGGKILLDGRHWASKHSRGAWIGPTIILHNSRHEPALHNEIFGPVLSILKVADPSEAIEIENGSPYGNAAAIYTSSGQAADWFSHRFRVAMVGVNIGIPVPRDPMSFGGLYGTLSKFGDVDITGEDVLSLFTTRRKITTKWGTFTGVEGSGADKAQFR